MKYLKVRKDIIGQYLPGGGIFSGAVIYSGASEAFERAFPGIEFDEVCESEVFKPWVHYGLSGFGESSKEIAGYDLCSGETVCA